jgi:hypothetical protein
VFGQCLGHLLSARATCPFSHGPVLCVECPFPSVLHSLCRLKSSLCRVNVKVRMHVVFMIHGTVMPYVSNGNLSSCGIVLMLKPHL